MDEYLGLGLLLSLYLNGSRTLEKLIDLLDNN